MKQWVALCLQPTSLSSSWKAGLTSQGADFQNVFMYIAISQEYPERLVCVLDYRYVYQNK